MSITKKDVEYVASLARLEINEAEKETFTAQLDNILGYVSKLNELDTDNVKPTSHVLQLQNVFRPDKVERIITREAALANAPDRTEEFFRVPQIIEA